MSVHDGYEAAEAEANGELDKFWARRGHEPVVYYMRMDRLIKIGWSTNIKLRVETIMPQGVVAVEYGGRDVERARHKQFMDHHSHLEWFWLREGLWDHIQNVRVDFEERSKVTTEAWLELRGARMTGLA